jgi:hypothetical protein
MSIKERILKDKRLLSGLNTMDSIRDGRLSILTLRVSKEPRDLTKASVYTSTDHSTSDQDSQ